MVAEAILIPDSPEKLDTNAQAGATTHAFQNQLSPDTRYILTEIGKLSVKVDRLVDGMASTSSKVDGLRGQVAFVKGAAWVIGVLTVMVGPIAGLIASGKLTIALH